MAKTKRTVHQRAFSVRLREDFLERVADKATRERRSVNAQFETIIEQWISREYGEEALRGLLETEGVAS